MSNFIVLFIRIVQIFLLVIFQILHLKVVATKDFAVVVVLSTDLQESGCFNRFTRRRVLVYGGVGLLSTYLQVFKVGVGCFKIVNIFNWFLRRVRVWLAEVVGVNSTTNDGG